ncbi:high affinity immunoglobulin epsilon receptor subunit alpha [Sorex araneus]|uniref:high affinity immunoglobulin epsilon receptor subunit alpha n=1 Tax=Sorex araneus TaxID=42254 RepID=UPI002433AAAB|nr:high affinity immunoglobulin epsilon receptor subunit alpha [Sorex araneus]
MDSCNLLAQALLLLTLGSVATGDCQTGRASAPVSLPPPSQASVTPKPRVSLSPPWSRIFRGESVTLTCHLGNGSLLTGTADWTHNSRPLNESTSSLTISDARELDSGEYRCQGGDTQPSDPVRLGIFSDWLLLQATAENLSEGEPLLLQCHSWKNWKVDKVIFYKDNVSIKYWYENHNISVDRVTLNDSGHYRCVGRVRKVERESEPVLIVVHRASRSSLPWLRLLVPALLLALLAADSALFVLTRQELTMLQRAPRGRKGRTTRAAPRSRTDPANR